MIFAAHMARIAFFRNKYLGVSETFIYQYLTHFKEHQPILLTRKLLPSAANFPFPAIYLAAPEKRFSPGWWTAQMDLRLLRQKPVIGMLKRKQIKLIHAHFGPDGCIAVPWAEELGIPLVTSFYGFDLSKASTLSEWREPYQTLFRQGALFLVEGHHMREMLIQIGCSREKIQIQRIAIDVANLPFLERRLKAGDPMRLLFCGRFVEKKGLEFALRALAEVVKINPHVTLRVVGDGELRQRMEQLIQSLQLGNHVTLAGLIPYQQLIDELLAAHILVAPSVTAGDGDSEGGAPTILLDAQATGLPIVSTYHADIPEVVSVGESALLAPERDVAGLASAILSLVENPEKLPGMGNAGRSFVQQNHDISLLGPQLEMKYSALIQGRE